MTTETIPLNKLSVWKGNVRKTGAEIGLDELKASIREHGLLNPLTVQKTDKGDRRVIAGQRRLLALRALHKEGTIPADHPVACTIVSIDSNATEISLAENVVRPQMHPADQFEAWRDLIDKGASVADVAARFGVSDALVTKRLKLGRVSPKLLDVYRKGDMTLEQVQALTLSDDHIAQEAAWDSAQGWQRQPQGLRQLLTDGEVAATDKRVQFIGGLEIYETAGGKVRRDLFDDRNAGYIADLTLLNSLVVRRLVEVAAEVRAEGWKWVETVADFDWNAVKGFDRVHEGRVALTPDQEARLSALGEQYDEVAGEAGDDDLTEEQTERLEQIETEMEGLQARQKVYNSDDILRAGCFVSIGHQGEAEIRRGYVKPEDMPSAKASEANAEDSIPAQIEAEDNTLPAALLESLTAERTAALRIEMAKNPHVALATAVYSLAIGTFEETHGGRRRFDREFTSCLGLSASSQSPEVSTKEPRACSELADATETWNKVLPATNADLWRWCLDATEVRLLELLAICVARSVNGIVHKRVSSASPAEVAHADALAGALHLDMTKWFSPTAENYFSRVSKPTIIKALVEMDGGTPVAPVTEKLKKGALAEFAEKAVGDSGWLPELLRSPQVSTGAEAEALDDAA